MQKKLSVLIPTFNSILTIRETLMRVMDIPLANLEIIVSDHESTDGTKEFIDRLVDSRIQARCESRQSSVATHWTNLSKLATGEFVKLVCADDLIEPVSVLKQLEILEDDPEINLVASKRKIISNSGKILMSSKGLSGLSGKINGHEAIKISIMSGTNQFGEPACVTFRNSVFQECLPWSENYPYVIDLDMYSKILTKGYFYGLNSVGAAFRVTNNSWSSKLSKFQSRQFINWSKQANKDLNLRISNSQIQFLKLKTKTISFARQMFEKFSN